MRTKNHLALKSVATCLCLALVCSAFVPALVIADDEAQQIRDITKKQVESVVEISATVSMSMGMQTQERQVSVRGTVIDATGIIVCSMFSLDSGGTMAYGQQSISLAVNPGSVKVTDAQGESFDAEIITQDKSLDLAFIRIKPDEEKELSLTAVDLSEQVTLELGDKVIAVSRRGKKMDYTPVFFTTRINSMHSKPRTFYGAGGIQAKGVLVFTMDGKVAGFLTVFNEGEADAQGAAAPFTIILPIEELANAWELAKANMDEEEEE